MKKVLTCMAFCLLFAPAVAFGSPQQTNNPQPAKKVQQTVVDENSIAGNNDPDLTPVQRGCCSWHGGVAGCDENSGRIICNDGTASPSCRC